jgi:hypothetical protein
MGRSQVESAPEEWFAGIQVIASRRGAGATCGHDGSAIWLPAIAGEP